MPRPARRSAAAALSSAEKVQRRGGRKKAALLQLRITSRFSLSLVVSWFVLSLSPSPSLSSRLSSLTAAAARVALGRFALAHLSKRVRRRLLSACGPFLKPPPAGFLLLSLSRSLPLSLYCCWRAPEAAPLRRSPAHCLTQSLVPACCPSPRFPLLSALALSRLKSRRGKRKRKNALCSPCPPRAPQPGAQPARAASRTPAALVLRRRPRPSAWSGGEQCGASLSLSLVSRFSLFLSVAPLLH